MIDLEQHYLSFSADDAGASHSLIDKEIVRKEIGLEWMLRPNDNIERKLATTSDHPPEEPHAEEVCFL